MAELADARDLKSLAPWGVRVRFPPSALALSSTDLVEVAIAHKSNWSSGAVWPAITGSQADLSAGIAVLEKLLKC